MDPPYSVGRDYASGYGLERHGRELLSTLVQYGEERNDDSRSNRNSEDEQLFIETIRRGALAVQQRRRRPLERPQGSSSQPGQAGQEVRHEAASGSSAPTVALSILPSPMPNAPSASPRSLLTTSLLNAYLDGMPRLSEGTFSIRSTASVGEEIASRADTRSSMMLLYCDSISMTLLPCRLFSDTLNDALVDAGSSTSSGRYITAKPYARPCPRRQPDGGCGRLLCARGFASEQHAHTYSTDTFPSPLLVDWLEILPQAEEETRWPLSCTCLQATLGCRNCGNPVGVSSVYTCDPCQYRAGSKPSWTFWTSRAMVRIADSSLSVMWDEQVATFGNDATREAPKRQPSEEPSKNRDVLEGLAGAASEWRERSETMLNDALASHWPQTNCEGTGLPGSTGVAPPEFDDPETEFGTGVMAREGSDRRMPEYTQLLQQGLRAHIARSNGSSRNTSNLIGRIGANDTSFAATSMTDVLIRRRRPTYLNTVDYQTGQGMPNDGDNEIRDRSETEFRRQRTAEILESGRRHLESEAHQPVIYGHASDGPVGR